MVNLYPKNIWFHQKKNSKKLKIKYFISKKSKFCYFILSGYWFCRGGFVLPKYIVRYLKEKCLDTEIKNKSYYWFQLKNRFLNYPYLNHLVPLLIHLHYQQAFLRLILRCQFLVEMRKKISKISIEPGEYMLSSYYRGIRLQILRLHSTWPVNTII